jgi:hypothetical protein
MKPSFIAKQNKSIVDLCSMHPHDITSLKYFSAHDADMPTDRASQTSDFLGDVTNLTPTLSSFSSVNKLLLSTMEPVMSELLTYL